MRREKGTSRGLIDCHSFDNPNPNNQLDDPIAALIYLTIRLTEDGCLTGALRWPGAEQVYKE